MDVSVEKVKSSDFDEILPLLLMFDSRVQIGDWKRLFTKYWEREEDYYGYKLVCNKKTRGYLGLLFSTRVIKGEKYRFANLTSWIVEPEWRSYSILLLNEVTKLVDYCLTDFTASENVLPMLKRFGFKILTNEGILIHPLKPVFNSVSNIINLIWDKEIIMDVVSDDEKKILQEHSSFNIIPILLKSSEDYSLVIIRKVRRCKLRFALIHYVSNKDFFKCNIRKFTLQICFKLKVFGIIIYKSLIGSEFFSGIGLKLPNTLMYKSEKLEIEEIDTLYSELIVLDL